MATFPQFSNPAQSGAPDLLNEALDTLEHQAVYGKKPATTSGLVWGYYGGRWGGFLIADGTLTLTGSTTNYIVVAIATGVASFSTSTTNWNDSTNYARVYKLTTSGSAVTAVEDHRAGPGGVHGGVSPGGGGVSDGDKGDITVSASGATWTIDNDTVTYAKMQNVSATSRVLARKTAGAGDPEEATFSEVLDFVGSAAQGDILYRGASVWTRLGAGTSGFYLQTQGAAANPVWAASSFVGGTLTGAINDAPKVTVASATTTNIFAAASNAVDVSGVNTITGFDTIADGAERIVTFTGVLTLTHNATSLILPGGANITTAAGDVAGFRSLGGGNTQCVFYSKASGNPVVTPSASLSGFTAALNSSSPNNTVNNSSFSASGGSASQGMALVWKGGSGYLSLDIPDSSATGGNVRGVTAVDLQKTRSTAAAIASGTASFLGGGTNNTASGANAAGFGTAVVASGDQSLALGNTTLASGANSLAVGNNSTTRGFDNTIAHASAGSGQGKNQRQQFVLRASTPFTATPATLSIDGSAATTTNIPVLPNSSAFAFTARVLMADGSDTFDVELKGTITRGANAASTAIQGSVTNTTISQSAGVAGKSWAVTAVADTTNGGLAVKVTGDAGGLGTHVGYVDTLQRVQ